jgi:PAS domain S-box-containing protein
MAKEELGATAYLAALVRSSEVAIYSEDLDELINSWNTAAERMFGYAASEALGQPIYLIIPPERHTEERDVQRRVRAGERVDHYNTVRLRKGGGRIHVSMVASPVRTPEGDLIGVSKVARDITAQKALEASLALTSALIELSQEAIFAWDVNGGIVEWNAGCERLYGYSRDEALGRVSHELLQTVRPLALETFLARLIERREWSGELHHRTRDGRDVIVESRHQVIDIEGRSLVLESNRDVTDRRHAEEARGRLAALVESSEDAIIGKTVSGVITSWNRAAERMFGYSAGEAIGQSIRLIIPQERRAEEDQVLARIGRGETVQHFETVRCRKDGSEIAVSLTISPIHDATGVIVGASKIARDNSEQKRASRRAAFLAEVGAVLAGSLDYLTTLKAVANLAVPSIAEWCAVDILTEQGRVERLAVAHVDPAKLDLARLVRSRYEDPSSPFSAVSVIRTGTPAMVKEISDAMIVAAAHGDEERIALVRSLGLRSFIIVPLTTRGRTLGALSLVTGESGPLYTDDDFRLAQDVAFRAALAVDNARAYNDAQAANRLKDEFLATLSHELRTPLNAILGYSRLLQSGMMTADKHTHAIQTVERNATSLTRIVEDILDVSRIISGKIRLSIQPVDFPNVVSNAVETVMPAAAARQVRVQTILDPRATPISGDPDRLQQIIWNLVSNAVKFTPKHGVVQIRLERVNSHVEIVVADTGIGMAPDFLPHVFERFRQADSATTREHSGLGLGLAIVRHLVELHGGTIHAASGGRDQGSTFTVRLPVMSVQRETPVERRIHPTTDLVRTDPLLPDLSGLSVLAVDDDADARALVCATLETRGARVIAVESAEEAFEALQRNRPDVVIADLGMAHTDGFALIKRIRQSDDVTVREMPAAVLTAYARAEDRMKALQSGFHLHLAKPVDPGELVVAVASLARRTRKGETPGP